MNHNFRNRFYSDFSRPGISEQTEKRAINEYFPESPKISNLVLDENIEEFNLEEEEESVKEFIMYHSQRKGSIVSQFINSKNSSNIKNTTSNINENLQTTAFKESGIKEEEGRDNEEDEEDNESIDSFEIEIENNKMREQSKETDSSTNKNTGHMISSNKLINISFGNIKKDEHDYDNEFLDDFDNLSIQCVDENNEYGINEYINNNKEKNEHLKKRDFMIFIEDEDINDTKKMKIKTKKEKKNNNNEKHEPIKNPFLASLKNDSEMEIKKEVDHYQGIVKHLLNVNGTIPNDLNKNNNLFYLNNYKQTRMSFVNSNNNDLLRNRSKSFNCTSLRQRPILEFMRNC